MQVLPGDSLFSPTYDDTIRRSRFANSSRPRPQSSTPQLFDTASRSVTPVCNSASISTDGMPHSPEAADRERRTTRDVGDGVGCARDNLVHTKHLTFIG